MDIKHYIFVELCNLRATERITEDILQATGNLIDFSPGHPLLK